MKILLLTVASYLLPLSIQYRIESRQSTCSHNTTSPAAQPGFPDCNRSPLCSNLICNPSASPVDRVAALLSALTAQEKIANLVNTAPGVSRLGLPAYQWWNEALHGYAYTPGLGFLRSGNLSSATSFPQPITLGAAFDDPMVNAIARIISTETRAFSNGGRSGLDVWTPNINPFRDSRWGRGQETPGEDPFHLQSYVRSLLEGLETPDANGHRKLIATCKHFAAYDLEGIPSQNLTRWNFDAVVSKQELSEYYLPPFKTCAVEAKVGAFMCSYNSVNGIPACQNPYLLQTILREHWAWNETDQWITSDCNAVPNNFKDHHYATSNADAAASALKSGTDLECNTYVFNGLAQAYNQSLIGDSDLDKALTRLYLSILKAGYFDSPVNQPYRNFQWTDVNTPEAQKLAYQAAVSGIVLLKNDGLLPLQVTDVKVALLGPMANATTQMQGNYFGRAPYLTSPVRAAQSAGLDFEYFKGVGVSRADATIERSLEAARNADVVIYIGGIDNSLEAEDLDRSNMTWPAVQLSFLSELKKIGKPTVVVQFGGGQVDDTALLSGGDSEVSALLWAGYPGQEGGTAILDIISGKTAPAGRLPVTQYPASYADAVDFKDMNLRPQASNNNLGRTHIWYTGKPVVPFGHGLHYTSFNLSWNAVPKKSFNIPDLVSGSTSTDWPSLLLKPVLSLELDIMNSGNTTSDYVALLFLRTNAGSGLAPLKQLTSYARAYAIEPGRHKTVNLTIDIERLARVDTTGSRRLSAGDYTLFVDIDEKVRFDFVLTGDELVIENFPQEMTTKSSNKISKSGGNDK